MAFGQGQAKNIGVVRLHQIPSSNIISAATFPDSITIGTPPPGWLVPPAKYKPLTSLQRLCGLRNAAKRLLADEPYSAPFKAPDMLSRSFGLRMRSVRIFPRISKPRSASFL